MKVAVRADAGTWIGTGHVMRCLALADELKRRDGEVTFISRSQPAALSKRLRSSGHAVVHLAGAPASHRGEEMHSSNVERDKWLSVTKQVDALETRAALKSRASWDWLIIDHYALDADWARTLVDLAGHILVVDDLADRAYECDVLLDQNLHSQMEGRYAGLVPDRCRVLLGPRYALLRQEFTAARAANKGRDGTVRRIFVMFGGTDPDNITGLALRAIDAIRRPDIAVDVVLGEANAHRASIERASEQMSAAKILVNPPRLAEIMASADLAVGASGSSSWERCSLGLPAVMLAVAHNQVSIGQSLAASGAGVFLGTVTPASEAKIADALDGLLKNPLSVKSMSERCHALADGDGAKRVADLMQGMT
jgi:UDP-2,4-diacetamido-2,4,6-trideoxy-beta-L-altropyranose hydrolase